MASGLKEAVIELREDDALRIADEELKGGTDPLEIVTACREAMDVIGQRFADGQAFIPELIMAGEIMQGITAKLKPYLKADAAGEKLGTVVMCTVQGDIHDIGKDIVVTMLDIAGFNVVDLGVDVPVAKVVETVRETNAQVLGPQRPAHGRLRLDEGHRGRHRRRGPPRPGQGHARRRARHGRGGRVRRRRRLGQGRGGRGRARQVVGGRCVMTLPDNWNELTPDQRLQFRLDAWQSIPIEFATPEVAQAYRDRVQLYRDVLDLKKPVTVPIAPWIGLLPFRYFGAYGQAGVLRLRGLQGRLVPVPRGDQAGRHRPHPRHRPGQAVRHPRLPPLRLARPRHA